MGCQYGQKRTTVRVPASRPAGTLLDLDHSDTVLARIDEPGHPGEANVGDTIDGLEARRVVVLDLDAALLQLSDLRPNVLHAERRLRLIIFGANRALAHCELTAAAALQDQMPRAIVDSRPHE